MMIMMMASIIIDIAQEWAARGQGRTSHYYLYDDDADDDNDDDYDDVS